MVLQARQYEHGEGVSQDRKKAVELYCQAARLGSPEGQYALGWMHANGRGVERNDSIAARFLQGRCGAGCCGMQCREGAAEEYRDIPPYSETVKYIDKILSRYNKTAHPFQPGVVSRTSFIFTSAGAEQ